MSLGWVLFVPPTRKDHDGAPVASEVGSVPCALMISKLKHAFADRLAVAKKSRFEATQPDAQLGLRRLVPNGLQPFGKRLPAAFRLISENLEHAECSL